MIHKPTAIYLENSKRTMKGNVNAELGLHSAAIEYGNYDKAIVITSDGDFTCLFNFLVERNKLGKIITPTRFYSSLFRPLSGYVLPLYKIAQRIKKDKYLPPKMPAFAFGRNLKLVRRDDILIISHFDDIFKNFYSDFDII